LANSGGGRAWERSLSTKAEIEETRIKTRTRRFDEPYGEDVELFQ